MRQEKKITIAVCTYRRFDELKICLQHLSSLTRLDQVRVLVIDNSLQREQSVNFRSWVEKEVSFVEYIITPKAGLSYARNIGLLYCDTKYIAYIDDDAFVEPDWVEGIFAAFESGERVGVVGGRVEPIWEIDRPAWLNEELGYQLAVLDYGEVTRRLMPHEWVVGANIVYDKKLLMEIGGFDENLGRKGDLLLCHEELDTNVKIRNLGYSIIYAGNASVKHIIQKERINQAWFCKNAFWERISHRVFENSLGSDSFSPESVKQINRYCDDLVEDWDEQSDGKSVIKKLDTVREKAVKVFSSLSFATTEKRLKSFVHIVTPLLNNQDILDRTISSVMHQQGQFYLRYHIQDGGSSDKSLDIVHKWKNEIYNGVFNKGCLGIAFTYESEADSGMYDAIKTAFSKMTLSANSVMGWINADDSFKENTLLKVTQSLQLKNVNWVFGQQYAKVENGDVFKESAHVYPVEFVKNGLCDGQHWETIQQEGSFWLYSLWQKVGGVDTSLKYAGDWDLWRRFSVYAYPVQLPFPTGIFTLRDGQLSEGGGYLKEVNSKLPQKERIRTFTEKMNDGEGLVFYEIDNQSEKFILTKKWLQDESQVPHCALDAFRLSEGKQQRKKRNAVVVESHSINSSLLSQILLLTKIFLKKLYRKLPLCVQGKIKTILFKFVKPVVGIFTGMIENITVRRSRLFLSYYYMAENPEIDFTKIAPLKHYLRVGSKEGRKPNPLFDDNWYRAQYPDVNNFQKSLLFHYYKYGWRNGYNPSNEFNGNRYLEENQEVKRENICPLKHYFLHGLMEK